MLEGWDALKFADEFEKDLLRSQKKAARKIGRKVQTEARRAMGKVSRERKNRLKYKVRRNGTLVWIDSGANARAREYGATISAAPGKGLRINFDKEDRGKDGSFIRAVGRNLLLFEGEGAAARPIAVIKRKVKIRESKEGDKLSKIATDKFDDYIDDIEKEITGG